MNKPPFSMMNKAFHLIKKSSSTTRRYFKKMVNLGLLYTKGANKNKVYALMPFNL